MTRLIVPLPDSTAYPRILRGATIFVGSGGFAYGVINAWSAAAQSVTVASWWTPFAFGAVFAPYVVMVVAAARARFDLVKAAAVAATVGYLAAVASWPLLRTGVLLPVHETLWIVMLPGLPPLALALFWRYLPFVALLATSVLAQLDSRLARPVPEQNLFALDLLFSLAYSALPGAACVMLIHIAHTLDASQDAAVATASATASARARDFERRRWDELTHDGVIATLIAAAKTANGPVLAADAAKTLANIDLLRAPRTTVGAMTVGEVATSVRAVAVDIDDSVTVSVEASHTTVTTVPGAVNTALCAAVAEALRNWQRHAGPSECTVSMVAAGPQLSVCVADDGVGFDPNAVSRRRLGLRASITRRMTDQPGGWALIDSTPGHGCTVTVGWRAR
ncbi:sensor histidine kinase [Nocardia lasii]|uniref:Sensor histidine kinase n=1 Tax=Nocardia lasii TaxID=1616107 RepID=A0ABW1K0E0_9NOCA